MRIEVWKETKEVIGSISMFVVGIVCLLEGLKFCPNALIYFALAILCFDRT